MYAVVVGQSDDGHHIVIIHKIRVAVVHVFKNQFEIRVVIGFYVNPQLL
jgi:hypothetical protein